MRRYLHLSKTFLQFALISSMAYPADFLTWAAIDFVWAFVNIGFFRILLLNVPRISGWTFDELVLPLGLFSLLNAFIWGTFYGNMKNLAKGVNRGDLDFIVIKPVSGQFFVSVKEVSVSLFPSVIVGIFLLIYGFYINHLNLISLLYLPVIIFSSLLIIYSLYFISVLPVFWTSRLSNISELMPQLADTARYPTQIFPVFMRFILTFIIPLGLLVIFPGQILLSRFRPINLLYPLLAGIILLYISHRLWRLALRHYSSASS